MVETVESESMSSRLFSLRLMFDRSKLEPLRDVSVTRIGDTLSYGFQQIDLMLTFDALGVRIIVSEEKCSRFLCKISYIN